MKDRSKENIWTDEEFKALLCVILPADARLFLDGVKPFTGLKQAQVMQKYVEALVNLNIGFNTACTAKAIGTKMDNLTVPRIYKKDNSNPCGNARQKLKMIWAGIETQFITKDWAINHLEKCGFSGASLRKILSKKVYTDSTSFIKEVESTKPHDIYKQC